MLNVSNLKVCYGQSEVIHGLDFTVPKNETLAIMGRNGMGKTTLFKSLIGILPTSEGSISIDGVDVTQKESFQRVERRHCLCAARANDISVVNSTGKYRNRYGGLQA